MAWVDKTSHSMRRVLFIEEGKWKVWCKICDGEGKRGQKRSKLRDSKAVCMAWWVEHEASAQHAQNTTPKMLNRVYEGRKALAAEIEMLDKIFAKPAS